MTTATSLTDTTVRAEVSPEVDARSRELRQDSDCDVCAHPAVGHDAIAHRFCNATQARALTRTCICRSL